MGNPAELQYGHSPARDRFATVGNQPLIWVRRGAQFHVAALQAYAILLRVIKYALRVLTSHGNGMIAFSLKLAFHR